MILVKNFGDPRICKSRIYNRDTKIFFFDLPLLPGQVNLNSSLLRINLFNLFKVQVSATKGWRHIRGISMRGCACVSETAGFKGHKCSRARA